MQCIIVNPRKNIIAAWGVFKLHTQRGCASSRNTVSTSCVCKDWVVQIVPQSCVRRIQNLGSNCALVTCKKNLMSMPIVPQSRNCQKNLECRFQLCLSHQEESRISMSIVLQSLVGRIQNLGANCALVMCKKNIDPYVLGLWPTDSLSPKAAL